MVQHLNLCWNHRQKFQTVEIMHMVYSSRFSIPHETRLRFNTDFHFMLRKYLIICHSLHDTLNQAQYLADNQNAAGISAKYWPDVGDVFQWITKFYSHKSCPHLSIHTTCRRTTYLHIVFTKCVNGTISRTICIVYTHQCIASSHLITLINLLTCTLENCTMLRFSTSFLYQERRGRGLITLQ